MKLKILGSSSKGNCYILENENETLILEAGVPLHEILKYIRFNTGKVAGVLVTHEHGDHAKYIKEFRNRALEVYLSQGTLKALDLNYCTYNIIKSMTKFKVGGFTVIPFKVEHDAAEPLGFLINHEDMGNLLFVTDTFYISNRFANLNHILIECNYCETILNNSGAAYKNRVFSSHMSLENCLEFLKANDLSNVENIVLLHLSDGHSDEKMMVDEVQKVSGVNTFVAEKGFGLELEVM